MAVGVTCILFVIIAAIVWALNKREGLLQEAIHKAQEKVMLDYGLALGVEKVSFSGLRSVQFEALTLVPIGRDTLAYVKHLEVSVKVLPLIRGKIKLADVHMEEASILFSNKDSIRNYDFVFSADSSAQDARLDTMQNLHLGQWAERVLNGILYKIPDNLRLRDFTIAYEADSLSTDIYIPRADMDAGELHSAIEVDQGKARWQLDGDLHPNRKELFFRLTSESGRVELPWISDMYGLSLSFDTLETHLKRVARVGKESLSMEGSWSISNLRLNHWRLASNDVLVPNVKMDAVLLLENNVISLEKTSKLKLGALELFPYAQFQILPVRTYAFGLEIPEIDAQKALMALPQGLFTSLEGLKLTGKIAYSFDLFLDETSPDSVRLSSKMREQDLTIEHWGETDLSKINKQFIYTPMENGKGVRNILVGPENPNFTPLEEISPNLRNAVLTAEDPSFFSHNGFVLAALKASIATNFKEKAFKRGGSTISMQLVKNVFLNREKTLSRKIEEMFIVWLMEHKHIVSKQRMFEVYLNIIEWGKNIYGIREAAHYYFLKEPAALDIGESIFLASIVPSPKTGIFRFDEQGILKPFLKGYYSLIGGIMARRGLISADSTQSYGYYSVTLRNAVRPRPVVEDSLFTPGANLEQELEDAKHLLEEMFNAENKTNENRD